MKKELEFDVKRMLSLVESKSGNIKPILSEEVQSELKEASSLDELPDRLQQFAKVEELKANVGCTTSSAGTWGVIDADTVKQLTGARNLIPLITVGTPYVFAKCTGSDGVPRDLMVTNIEDPSYPNSLVVIQYTFFNKKKTYTVGSRDMEALFERKKSVTSQSENLTASQNMRVKQLIGDSGPGETGYSWTVDRPDGTEDVDYVPVDLATGMANINGNDVQVIEKLKLDGLTPEFKTPGRFHIWARVGTKTTSIDIPEWLEGQLTTMGYTKEMPTDEIQQGAVTTLEAICNRTGQCTPQMLQYMKTNPNAKFWPLEVSADDIKKKQCRGVIKTLAACARAYEKYKNRNVARANSECNKGMDQLGAEYSGIDSYNGKILKLKNDYAVCSDQRLGLFAGQAKKDNEFLSGLGKGGNPFSPDYSAQEAASMAATAEKAKQDAKKGAMMEESISRSLRKVLKEHTKPNSDDMIKRSVRKNLRRLL